jgi:hypothetical protein
MANDLQQTVKSLDFLQRPNATAKLVNILNDPEIFASLFTDLVKLVLAQHQNYLELGMPDGMSLDDRTDEAKQATGNQLLRIWRSMLFSDNPQDRKWAFNEGHKIWGQRFVTALQQLGGWSKTVEAQAAQSENKSAVSHEVLEEAGQILGSYNK